MVEHVDFVTRLARSLIKDEQAASDAAQEALTAAIASPPQHADHARGWLSRVLRRSASRDRRTHVRRTRREALSAPEPMTPPVSETVANVETHRDLANEVLRLAEPYRTTITLRYFEDLSIEAVAERMGVPKNTARSRLTRGLAQLRERLEQRFGQQAAWVAAVLPLARRQVGSTAGRVVLTTASGILMKKFVAVALAATICLIAWRLVSPPETRTTSPTDSSVLAASGSFGDAGSEQSASDPVARQVAPPANRIQVVASPPETAPAIVGHRLLDAMQRPIAQVRMRLLGPQSVRWQGGDGGWISGPRESLRLTPSNVLRLQEDSEKAGQFFAQRHQPEQWRATILGMALPDQEVVTDANGLFQFAEREPVAIKEVELVESGWALIARPKTDAGAFIGERAVQVRGRVVDPSGNGIGSAFISIDVSRVLQGSADECTAVSFPEMRSAKATGSFALRQVPTSQGVLLRVRAKGYATAVLPVPAQDSSNFDVLLWPIDEQQRLLVDGTVVDRNEQPIANALVAIGRTGVRTDAGGQFRVQLDNVDDDAPLSVVATGLQAYQATGFGRRLRDDPNSGRRLRIRLAAPSRQLRGVVLEPGGNPAVGYGMNLVDPTLLGYSFTSVEARTGDRKRSIATDDAGRFALTGLNDRPYRIRLWNPSTGFVHLAGPFTPGQGDLVVQLPESARGRTLIGRCMESDGKPATNVRVGVAWCTYVTSGGGTMWEDTGRNVGVDAEGRFELASVPRGAGVLVAQDANGRRAVMPLEAILADAEVTLTMSGGGRWLRLLPRANAPGLTITCIAADGSNLEFAIWQGGASRTTDREVVNRPMLLQVPAETTAVVIAAGTAIERRVALEAETTHVHMRGTR
tara:strand:- start:23533 stop:26124 length:2592 start_codon:yes stop_codon:yes gene_type:complete